MDLKLVKNLLDLISDSDVNEVSIEEGDFKIKVKKTSDIRQADSPA
jgi:acetyl-CoA carboxylase biotin carboxyl carrier protein